MIVGTCEICMKESSWKRLAWQVQLAALILGAAHCVQCAKVPWPLNYAFFIEIFYGKNERTLLEMWETTIFFAIAVIAVRPWLSLWQDLFRFRHLRETQFRFLVPLASCLSSKSGRQSGSTMPTCKTSGCGSCCSLHVVPVQFPSAHRWEQRETGKSCWQSERAELRWWNRLHTSSGSQGGGLCGSLCFGPFYDPTP